MMFMQRSMWKFFAAPLLVLLTALLAACGSTGTSGSTAGTSTATTCLTAATGTIQSVNSSTLFITNLQGNTVQATLTSKTIFIRQATLTAADIKTASPFSVIVMQNPDTTYTALTVNVGSSLTRLKGGFKNGSAGATLCNGQRIRGKGTPGVSSGNGTPGPFNGGGFGGQNRQTINGTVSQLTNNSLVVVDASGNNFTVTLTATTRISATQTVTASDLQPGEAVTLTGVANSQGVINASTVSILQSLPTRRVTPTPAAGA